MASEVNRAHRGWRAFLRLPNRYDRSALKAACPHATSSLAFSLSLAS
jgi:hypothetical protein